MVVFMCLSSLTMDNDNFYRTGFLFSVFSITDFNPEYLWNYLLTIDKLQVQLQDQLQELSYR